MEPEYDDIPELELTGLETPDSEGIHMINTYPSIDWNVGLTYLEKPPPGFQIFGCRNTIPGAAPEFTEWQPF